VGHPTAIALLVLLLLGSGCANLRWAVQKSLRDPGEVLSDFPEVVWDQYDCDTQKRPFFIIEDNELIPPRVDSGDEFNHRMIYVMCPDQPTEVVSGRLATRIRFKGDPIAQLTEEHYEIKPGRWVIDASVALPEDAEPGVYAYEVEFESDSLDFEKQLTFVVEAP
jgi:hypothetical protein